MATMGLTDGRPFSLIGVPIKEGDAERSAHARVLARRPTPLPPSPLRNLAPTWPTVCTLNLAQNGPL